MKKIVCVFMSVFIIVSGLPLGAAFASNNNIDSNLLGVGYIFENLDLKDISSEQVVFENNNFNIIGDKIFMENIMKYRGKEVVLMLEGDIYNSPLQIKNRDRAIIDAKSNTENYKILHMSVEKNALQELLLYQNRRFVGKNILRLAVMTPDKEIIYLETPINNDKKITEIFNITKTAVVDKDLATNLINLEMWFAKYNNNVKLERGPIEAPDLNYFSTSDEAKIPGFVPKEYFRMECEKYNDGSEQGYYIKTIPYMCSDDIFMSSFMSYIFYVKEMKNVREIETNLQIKDSAIIMYTKTDNKYNKVSTNSGINLENIQLGISTGIDIVEQSKFYGEAFDKKWLTLADAVKAGLALCSKTAKYLYAIEELLSECDDTRTEYRGIGKDKDVEKINYGDYGMQINNYGGENLVKGELATLNDDFWLNKEFSSLTLEVTLGYNEAIDYKNSSKGYYKASYKFQVTCDGEEIDFDNYVDGSFIRKDYF